MGIEIERKFLVNGQAWRTSHGVRLVQGYLCRETNYSVRVRIAGDQATLGIKGRAVGGVKPEFEYPLPLEEARSLLALCPEPPIEKIRHEVECGGFLWEIDEFLGANKGLVVAEIELDAPDESFPLPDWVGADVTDDPRYLNANLVRHPFSTWP